MGQATRGKWGKNAVVAGVALGCALLVMGVVGLDGRQSNAAAGPEAGWQPSEPEVLREPVALPQKNQPIRR